VTFSASRVAGWLCAAGASALAASLFVHWTEFVFPRNGWQVLSGIDVLLAVCAALAAVAAFAPRLRTPAALLALAAIVALLANLTGSDNEPATTGSPGPWIALVALVAIAAGGTGLRGRALAVVGAAALFASTFAAWYGLAVEGAYFNRSDGTTFYAPLFGSLPNAWHTFAFVDVALAVTAAVAVLAALAGGRSARIAAGLAVAVLGLVVWRALDPPLDGARIGSGLILAAASLVTIAAGGLLTPARSR
jgi:hypothetical protein